MAEYNVTPLSSDVSVRFTVTVDELAGWARTELAERTFIVSGDWSALHSLELGTPFQRTFMEALAAEALAAASLAQLKAEQEPDDAPPA